MKVLVRCDGSHEIGLGHVVRCLSLADELVTEHGCAVTFAMRNSELGIFMVREKYPVLTPHTGNGRFNYDTWMEDLIKLVMPDVLILDVRDGLAPEILERIKLLGVLVVDIDDPEIKRLKADLVFYPPVPQVDEMDWDGFDGKLYSGWEWVILKKEFACQTQLSNKANKSRPIILVSMGGSDPKQMVLKVVKSLNQLDSFDFTAEIIIGDGFKGTAKLKNELSRCRFSFCVYECVKNMAELMASADLAICAFGVTAYELAAAGVPAIHLCLSKDHARSSESFVRSDIARSMGVYENVGIELLSREINLLMSTPHVRQRMGKNGQKLMKNNGAKNIANTINCALQ